jgi:hypothetical protein
MVHRAPAHGLEINEERVAAGSGPAAGVRSCACFFPCGIAPSAAGPDASNASRRVAWSNSGGSATE